LIYKQSLTPKNNTLHYLLPFPLFHPRPIHQKQTTNTLFPSKTLTKIIVSRHNVNYDNQNYCIVKNESMLRNIERPTSKVICYLQ
jgi:hypothetical protein